MGFMRHIIGIWLLLQLVLSPAQLSAGQTLTGLQQYAKQLADSRLFAGMVHVEQGGSTVFSQGFGLAHYELGVPMRNDHRYPIGSNTKLFTAVAVWQLHRAGKLNVYDPASKYLNHTELGLEGPWCPRVYGAADTGACQSPQIQHLLRMSGGILGFDNCAYKPDAWQQDYCLGGAKSAHFSFDDYQALQIGAAGIATYLRLTGTLKMPLEFEPGSSYHYSNPGYSLAGYIVEKVSGMPLADYFRTNIFDKYGLTSTLYDPTNGILGIHKGQLPYPAYITYLHPGQTDALTDTAGATVDQLTASAGNPAYWGGDAQPGAAAAVGNASGVKSDPTAGGVSVGMTAKYPGPSGFDWTLANAAGAIVSTPQDMAKWLRALLVEPGHLGLGKDLLREFLTLSTQVPGMPSFTVSSEGRTVNTTLTFAQGLVVLKDPGHPRGLGVSNVYYLGSLGAFQASIYMWLHPSDASKDVFVNAVAATVLPDRSNWPEVAQNMSGSNCSALNSAGGTGKSSDSGAAGGHSSPGGNRRMLGATAVQSALAGSGTTADVSGLLCELTTMAPSAIKTVPDLLARKAYKALMGREWFDMQ